MATATDTLTRRMFVWDLIDERWPELWDQPAPLKASPHLVRVIAAELGAAFPTQTMLHGSRDNVHRAFSQYRRMVRGWLDNPDKFSPTVDRIAVERALAFDWAAVRGLTDLERAVVVDALAQMDDPWSERDNQGGIEEVARHLFPGMFNSRSGRSTGAKPSHRRLRFLAGDPAERRALNVAMNKRRKRVAA